MTKPAISVVIPCFNEEERLSKCLESIQKQTFTNFEVIVVDNNCTDRTAKIARSYGARVVKEKKQGMTPARERGFKAAKADIIARTDADTCVPKTWLATIYQSFRDHPDAVAITGPMNSNNKQIPDKISHFYSHVTFEKLAMFLTGHIFLIGPNMGVRKSAWKRVKITASDKEVHEDVDLSCRLAQVGNLLFVEGLNVPMSLRRLEENPIRGAAQYFIEYPIRYILTIRLHNPQLRPLKKFAPKVKGRPMMTL